MLHKILHFIYTFIFNKYFRRYKKYSSFIVSILTFVTIPLVNKVHKAIKNKQIKKPHFDVLSEIKRLNFLPIDYVVIGGAALAGRGIKETQDIDLLVSKKLLNELRQKEGWRYHPRLIPSEEAGLVNGDGTVELYPTVGKLNLSFEDIKDREEIINGIPFANLHDILKIKEAYGREKDLKDIERIKKYLEKE